MFHYTVYKSTCIINNKFYIGAHKTKNHNDDYLGSGSILRNAVNKYGKENFKKELLADFSNQLEMFDLERELIANEKSNPLCMNIREGGLGGFDFAENVRGILLENDPIYRARHTENARRALSFAVAHPKNIINDKEAAQRGREKGKEIWTGMHHKTESRKIMSEKKQGNKNHQFGKIWIYNLVEKLSTRISKELLSEYLEKGWIKGRKINFG